MKKGRENIFSPDQVTVDLLFEKVGVLGDERLPLSRKLVFQEYCIDRTFRFAKSAIDTFVRVNKELVFSLVDAVDWTNSYARFVFDADTGFSNHIGHNSSILQKIISSLY